MTTIKRAVRRQRIKRLIWIIAIILIIGLANFLTSPQLGQVFQALAGPHLPELKKYESVIRLNNIQNWDDETADIFWHISQGTSTFPIPVSWLLALEAPASSIFTMPLRKREKFASDDYLLRFGFIKDEVSDQNPYGLPVGFALTHYESLEGIDGKSSVVGFTCAACHTAQLAYNGKQYIIEGGPASTDIGQVITAVGAALGQTLVSAKIPFFDGRFERFAKGVLGDDAYKPQAVAALEKQLQNVILNLANQPNGVDVIEGFARLDALNRIGNQIFAIDSNRFGNYVAINAPVNFPHLWTAPWFEWAQYDASIMNPLVRNAGEAMGVMTNVDTRAPRSEARFSSSIPLDNLAWIEHALRGENPPSREEGWSGLLAPKWPDAFPSDPSLVEKGGELYRENCMGCHLPPINTPEDWPVREEIWDHIGPISYYEYETNKNRRLKELPTETEDVLKLKIISIDQVGTDPATGQILASRTVDTAGKGNGSALENTEGLGIDTMICSWMPTAPAVPPAKPGDHKNKGKLVPVLVTDNPDELFAFSLGALVQEVSEEWFRQNFISKELQEKYTTDRPNCLQAGAGYKARPLNGVWATAPFLHNGSVPTVMDLLSPVNERPEYVLLGDIEFDPEKLGLVQPERLAPRGGKKYNRDGYFILDTKVPGNRNSGHEFSKKWDKQKGYDDQEKGVIGRYLEPAERKAIIEFLKTI